MGENGCNVQVVAETIQPRGTENKILAAFIALNATGEEHDAKFKQATVGLCDRLVKVLPSFMIPTVYIPLQSMPRTITGKIDRRQLQAHGSSLTSKDLATLSRIDGERQAPQSDMERLIQGLWAEVLKIDPDSISTEDSFMRLGGDSIGAMRLVGMARHKGLSLEIRDIFRNPILRDLAAVCG
jgi:aryl carrier-like protein